VFTILVGIGAGVLQSLMIFYDLEVENHILADN
jgi:hypothetical protein